MMKTIKINVKVFNIFNNTLAVVLLIAISCCCCSCSYYEKVFVTKDQDYNNAKSTKPLKINDPALLIEKNDHYKIPEIQGSTNDATINILPPNYNNSEQPNKI